MIADKIIKSVYTANLKGPTINSIIPDADAFGIESLFITTNFFDSDLDAIAALEQLVSNLVNIKKPKIVREYNAEFYPSLDDGSNDFTAEVNLIKDESDNEMMHIKASTSFDKNGDYKVMRLNYEDEFNTIVASVIADPTEYLKEKQNMLMSHVSDQVRVH